MSNVRPELASALIRFGMEKGGGHASIAAEIVPVVLIDDNSKGPYPAYRRWQAFARQGASAGNFAYVGVINNDPQDCKSVVVIERVIYRMTVADDLVALISSSASIGLVGLNAADDIAEEKDQGATDRPRLGQVQGGVATSATGLGGTAVPCQDTLQHCLEGPWTIGPQGVFALRSFAVTIGVHAYFCGRYYSQL